MEPGSRSSRLRPAKSLVPRSIGERSPLRERLDRRAYWLIVAIERPRFSKRLGSETSTQFALGAPYVARLAQHQYRAYPETRCSAQRMPVRWRFNHRGARSEWKLTPPRVPAGTAA